MCSFFSSSDAWWPFVFCLLKNSYFSPTPRIKTLMTHRRKYSRASQKTFFHSGCFFCCFKNNPYSKVNRRITYFTDYYVYFYVSLLAFVGSSLFFNGCFNRMFHEICPLQMSQAVERYWSVMFWRRELIHFQLKAFKSTEQH